MMAQGAKFSLNQDILFEHVVHGNNLSLDSRRELSSLEECTGVNADSHTSIPYKMAYVAFQICGLEALQGLKTIFHDLKG